MFAAPFERTYTAVKDCLSLVFLYLGFFLFQFIVAVVVVSFRRVFMLNVLFFPFKVDCAKLWLFHLWPLYLFVFFCFAYFYFHVVSFITIIIGC